MEESSFETLEALSMAISRSVARRMSVLKLGKQLESYRFKVCLEKPIAVTLADAPCVELSIEARDVMDLAAQ